jgi:hypothetical protein
LSLLPLYVQAPDWLAYLFLLICRQLAVLWSDNDVLLAGVALEQLMAVLH